MIDDTVGAGVGARGGLIDRTSCSPHQAAMNRPNVLLILSDQQRWASLSTSLWDDPAHRKVRDELLARLLDWIVPSKTVDLGFWGGLATVPPKRYVMSTIDTGRR